MNKVNNQDQDTIFCTSIVSDNNTPFVEVSYKQIKGTLSVSIARSRATELIRAAAISETEGGILKTLRPKAKGFGKPNKKDEQMYAKFLLLIRESRPKIHQDINPIFGYHTQKPLIDYSILGQKLQLEISTALHHAQVLLECAEAAETDSFLKTFGTKHGLDATEIAVLNQEFAEYRKLNRLENMLDI